MKHLCLFSLLAMMLSCSDLSGGGEMIVEYHEDGSLSARGYQKGINVKTGEWEYFRPNGSVESSGSYVDGEKQGDWSYWADDGSLLASGTGLKWSVVPGLPWDELVDSEKFYFTDENRGYMKLGEREGVWTFWDHPDPMVAFDEDSEIEDGEQDPRVCIGRITFLGGSEDGPFSFCARDEEGVFDPNKTEVSGSFKNDELHGAFELFHPNGQLFSKGVYDEGSFVGHWQWWDEEGHSIGEVHIVKGEMDLVIPSRSGGKSAEGKLLDGAPHGMWRYFAEDGEVAAEGMMVDGKEQGEWRHWSLSREEEETEWTRELDIDRSGVYEDGVRVGPLLAEEDD